MHPQTWSQIIYLIMFLFSAKPLPKLMIIYGQVGHWEQKSLNNNQITSFPDLADNVI